MAFLLPAREGKCRVGATLALARLGGDEWNARPIAARARKATAGRESNTGAERAAAEIRREAAARVREARPRIDMNLGSEQKLPRKTPSDKILEEDWPCVVVKFPVISNLVEQQPPQGVLVCDHAGLVINKFSLSNHNLRGGQISTTL